MVANQEMAASLPTKRDDQGIRNTSIIPFLDIMIRWMDVIGSNNIIFSYSLWSQSGVLHELNYSCRQANTLNLVTHLWKVRHVPILCRNPVSIEARTQFIDLYNQNFDIWTVA